MHEARTASTASVESIRERIRQLYRSNPQVHITVQMPHTKIPQSSTATITGVYPHVFCLEDQVGGVCQRHSFQYTDVLTHRVTIAEL